PEEWIVQASSAAVQLTRAFQQAIERNYRQRRQVQAYAEMLGVTSNYLVKTVREMTSMTPKQLLQERLLLEAKRLLVHTPYSVNEISELLEFPNSTSFARWFKKEATQTPTEFRQQATNNLRLNRQSS
ncbi:MAG: AraC family transcriptional regulator, partial [Chloroflexota bacterium]